MPVIFRPLAIGFRAACVILAEIFTADGSIEQLQQGIE